LWLLIGFAICFLIGIVLIGVLCSPWLAVEVVVVWGGSGYVLIGPTLREDKRLSKAEPLARAKQRR
jgi:hypothetical protein